ncbi:hypothetical protein BRC95_11155 [Halobacteriales archaeon QS_5_68_33]|jgi:hypothetical protein|nr:MAG: hypothetical protein BRC95_11155 [Halobacteriales archaeon QS_5_68_33]
MSERRASLAGVVPAAGLVLAVFGVGAVAMYAESRRDWGSYFLMERAMSVGADLVVPLLVLALLGCFALVALAPRFEE